MAHNVYLPTPNGMRPVDRRLRRSGRFSLTFAVALFFFASLSLVAQEREKVLGTADDAIPGKVRVRIAQTLFQENMEPQFFGAAAADYGIQKVTPWLNRGLLRYIERRSGLYRRNGNIDQGLGGRAAETQAHSLMRIVVVEYNAKASPEEVARALSVIPGVEFAEPIWRHELLYTPNDPRVKDGTQWYLETIKAMDAWDQVKADSSIVIGIVDTGIERLHTDLNKAIWYNPGETGNGKESNHIDDDGNGQIDDWWGYDFSGTDGHSPDNDPSPELNDHGVHVAGIAGAAGDNDIYGAGVAYGVRLMAVKIGDGQKEPSLPGGFDGILYAAAMGADVINCSWGARKYSIAENAVIDMVVQQMRIPIVAAIGNKNSEYLLYPAGYKNVLSVAATRSGDGKAGSSNYHYNVDICAPGDNIYSTLDGNSFGSLDGTSMASPMVAAGAALLLQKDPTLTPEQIYEILRATSDNIDLAIGIQYKDKLGSGRLNVGRAVEKMGTIASARIADYTMDESIPNGIIEAGEEISMRINIRNMLAASSGVSVSVTAVNPIAMPINDANVDLGPMQSGEIMMTPTGMIRFTVPPNTPPDSRIVLNIVTRTENRTNSEYILLNVLPTFATTNLNKIACTFNSVGNVGYNGMNREQGDGFYFEQKGSLMWHGGLMVGTAEEKLVDVVRRGPSEIGTNDGFEMVSPFRLQRDQEGTVETGSAAFTDKHDVLGIDVEMHSYEFRDDSSSVIAVYKLINNSGERIDNLHCGLYLDWDLQSSGLGDQANYDPDKRMGYVRNSNDPNIMLGAALLSDQTVDFYAVDNLDENEPVSSNFTNELKWRMLSKGVSKSNTQSNTDVSMVIGGGPVTIEAGETATFVFGMAAAENFPELRAAMEQAKNRYLLISDVPPSRNPVAEVRLEATPNPFSDETQVLVQMPVAGDVRLEIVDLRGNSIGALYNGRLESGEHTFRFDSKELPSGVYFCKLRGEGINGQEQIILVR